MFGNGSTNKFMKKQSTMRSTLMDRIKENLNSKLHNNTNQNNVRISFDNNKDQQRQSVGFRKSGIIDLGATQLLRKSNERHDELNKKKNGKQKYVKKLDPKLEASINRKLER